MGPNRSLQVLATLALGGCALGIQGPAPDRPRHQQPRCDTGKTAVALDGILATGLTLGAVAAFDGDENGTGLALLAAGGLFLASAMRGHRAATACQVALAEYTPMFPRLDDDEAPRAVRRAPPAAPVEAAAPIAAPEPPPEPAPAIAPAIARPAPKPTPTLTPPPTLTAPTTTPPRPPTPPPTTPPRTTSPPTTTPPTADDDADGDWSAFWKEVP